VHVARFVCALAAASVALVLVLPAAADGGRTARGVVLSVDAGRIVVRGADGIVRCAAGKESPSLDSFVAGDRVELACRRGPRGLVLARIKHLPTPAPAPAGDVATVRFGGAVTALGERSVSLHDGDRDLTCTLGASSPALSGVKVGDHLRVVCTGGVLTSFEAVRLVAPPIVAPPPSPPPALPVEPAVLTFGVVGALSESSITVHNAEHGDVSCSVGSASPRLGDFHVGDRVKVACTDGHVLVAIVRF
jgi:hypothetical protein